MTTDRGLLHIPRSPFLDNFLFADHPPGIVLAGK
jgi:hypothetical protein